MKNTKNEKNKKKHHIVLDLDSTVIYSLPLEKYKPDKHREKAKKFNFHKMDDYYLVFERPYLQEFLDYIFKNFYVSVWTAATQSYALFIIENIILQNKPERNLDYILFSYHCDISVKNTDNTKNLSMFYNHLPEKYNKKNTFIIDDYDEVSNTQLDQCIRAPAFKFKNKNSEKDIFLKQVKEQLQNIKDQEHENLSIKINLNLNL
jgi:hypothetical protein